MAINYPDSVKYDALLLYLQGENYEHIARELSKSHPKLVASTIRKWGIDNGWEAKRFEFRKEREEKALTQARSIDDQMLEKLNILTKAAFHSIVDDSGKAIIKTNSLDKGLLAITKAFELMNKLYERNKDNFNPIEFFKIIYESFQEVPEIADTLNKPGVREKFESILKLKASRRIGKEIIVK